MRLEDEVIQKWEKMRRSLAFLVVFFSVIALHGQKARYGQDLPFPKKGVDYPLSIHITRIHVQLSCLYAQGYCTRDFVVGTQIDRKLLEFTCSSGLPEKPADPALLELGVTQGRELSRGAGFGIGGNYELISAQGRVLKCWESGVAE